MLKVYALLVMYTVLEIAPPSKGTGGQFGTYSKVDWHLPLGLYP
jgi:hypothetical protein